jgi:queuine tRNA-ribosyltransferase
MLGKQIATLHNIRFYIWLMEEARKRITNGTFYKWKNALIKKLNRRL